MLTRFGNQVDRREAERTSVEQALEQSSDRRKSFSVGFSLHGPFSHPSFWPSY